MYVCICLVARINQCFQKFMSSNVFYARARQMMPVSGPPQELGAKLLYSYL